MSSPDMHELKRTTWGHFYDTKGLPRSLKRRSKLRNIGTEHWWCWCKYCWTDYRCAQCTTKPGLKLHIFCIQQMHRQCFIIVVMILFRTSWRDRKYLFHPPRWPNPLASLDKDTQLCIAYVCTDNLTAFCCKKVLWLPVTHSRVAPCHKVYTPHSPQLSCFRTVAAVVRWLN